MENRLPLLDATDRVFIAGRWRSGASSETLPLINPSDGSTLAAIAPNSKTTNNQKRCTLRSSKAL